MTPVKHWLVRIFLKKLELQEQWNLGKLVEALPHGKGGTMRIESI